MPIVLGWLGLIVGTYVLVHYLRRHETGWVCIGLILVVGCSLFLYDADAFPEGQGRIVPAAFLLGIAWDALRRGSKAVKKR